VTGARVKRAARKAPAAKARARKASARTPSGKAGPVAAPPSFAPVAAAFSGDRSVTLEKGWGSGNVVLKVKGKIFAMTMKDDFVAKLPAERVGALVDAGKGAFFDPRHDGRLMKEWVVVAPGKGSWIGLAREALEFVRKAL
jgi:nucleoid-associated protein YgaU